MSRAASSRRRGLTLVEALIALSIAAIVAAALLPMAGRITRDGARLADRSGGAAAAAVGEAQFRRLIQATPGAEVRGTPLTLSLAPRLDDPAGCATPQSRAASLLLEPMERGGVVLVCVSDELETVLARWPEARAAEFRYASTPAAWTGDTRAGRAVGPPLVRLAVLGQGEAPLAVWIARAAEAPAGAAAAAGREAAGEPEPEEPGKEEAPPEDDPPEEAP